MIRQTHCRPPHVATDMVQQYTHNAPIPTRTPANVTSRTCLKDQLRIQQERDESFS